LADIFVSYTSSDREWAFWIGQELTNLGDAAHLHEWEIPAGGDIPAWMEARLQEADRVLCVVSAEYLAKEYSGWERRAAHWAAASKRRNFMLLVLVQDCELPIALAHIKRCALFGLGVDDARAGLTAYLAEPKPPTGPVPFPGRPTEEKPPARTDIPFPGDRLALSNIATGVPRHFLGREDAISEIDVALKREGGVAITTLHGMRGVGKTVLAAAYAERHRADYRATWWVRAETSDTMRADLVSLGVRLGWTTADEKEEPALEKVRERLRNAGEGLLLIYDNAVDAASVSPYLPGTGAARVLVTSNAHAWRGVAAPVEISVWRKEVGAEFLVARAGRPGERSDAEALSVELGGLPLAHEQAAAYCERLGVSFAEYRERFRGAPARLLDADKDAPADYHGGLTVARTFALAMDEAAKLHPAAESLITYAALLAPEPIPLFLFSEARDQFGESLASQLLGDGLDEAIAALRAFALVERHVIADERDPIATRDVIRLHRLVRTVASERLQTSSADAMRQVLLAAMALVYPFDLVHNPAAWPRARQLDTVALHLACDHTFQGGARVAAARLVDRLATHRQNVLTAYPEAQRLFKQALAT
jgi:hypothetical protein